MKTTKTVKEVKIAPVKTSDRNRPNKTFIQQMVEFQKFITEDQKTQLSTLDVKNVSQRINNRAMCETESHKFSDSENVKLQKLMAKFVKESSEILKKK